MTTLDPSSVARAFGYLEATRSGAVVNAQAKAEILDGLTALLDTEPTDLLLRGLRAAVAARTDDAVDVAVRVLAGTDLDPTYRASALRLLRTSTTELGLVVDTARRLIAASPENIIVQAEAIACFAAAELWAEINATAVDDELAADTTTTMHRSLARARSGHATTARELFVEHIANPASGLAADRARLADLVAFARDTIADRDDLTAIVEAALEVAENTLTHHSVFLETVEATAHPQLAARVFDAIFNSTSADRPATLVHVEMELLESGLVNFLLLVWAGTAQETQTVDSALDAAERHTAAGRTGDGIALATTGVERAARHNDAVPLSENQCSFVAAIAPFLHPNLATDELDRAASNLRLDRDTLGTQRWPPDGDTRSNMADLTELFRAGDSAGALRAATRLSLIERRSALPLGLVAEALIESGQHVTASLLTDELARHFPDDAGVALRRAKLATWYGRHDLVTDILTAAIRARPVNELVLPQLLDWLALHDPDIARKRCLELLDDNTAASVHPLVKLVVQQLEAARHD